MSSMNFLDKLLDEVDVEWKALGSYQCLAGKQLANIQLSQWEIFPV